MTQSHDILAILWPHDDLLISGNGNQTIRWLSSDIARYLCLDLDIRRRIGLASAVMSSLDNIWKDTRLSLSIKLRVYLALVQSVLLCASETWTLTVADSKSLDAFHTKCQRRILGISWHQFVWNEEVAALTGLSSLSDTICRRRSAIFGHIARLGKEVPAHKALRTCISWTSTGHFLEASSWSPTWQVDRPVPKR